MSDPEAHPGAATTPSDAAYGLDPVFVREVVAALDDGEPERVRGRVVALHAADVADLLDQITADQRRVLIDALRAGLDPDVLTELDERIRGDVVGQLETGELAAAVAELDTDDAVDVLKALDETDQRDVLNAVPAEDRMVIEQALAHPEDTAGRLMQRDLVAVPEFWTVGQTIDFLRESDDLPDKFYEIFVVDPAHRPIGTIPLDRAMRSKREVVAGDIMDPNPLAIPVATDQEEVAYAFQQYDHTSAPVIDAAGRLVGVIMIDDIVDVIHEEHEEDLLRLGGVGSGDLHESAVVTTRRRFSWLLVNLGTAIIASVVIAFFDATIEKIVALAILMPIVASMGGNAGTQTLTVTVRALATKDLTATNAMRLVNKEVVVGFFNGVVFASLIGVVAGLWFGDAGLGAVLAAAMVINLLIAGLAGILIPLALVRLHIDPALAASVFLTTITDVVGFGAFLGLGAWLLL